MHTEQPGQCQRKREKTWRRVRGETAVWDMIIYDQFGLAEVG